METFYEQLTATTLLSAPGATDASRSMSVAGNGSLLQTSVSRKQRTSEKEGEMRRHVERLLLRMDFNRMFSNAKMGKAGT